MQEKNPALYPNSDPPKAESQKGQINHESTKGRKHEKIIDKFRAFYISCFRDEIRFRRIIKYKEIATNILKFGFASDQTRRGGGKSACYL